MLLKFIFVQNLDSLPPRGVSDTFRNGNREITDILLMQLLTLVLTIGLLIRSRCYCPSSVWDTNIIMMQITQTWYIGIALLSNRFVSIAGADTGPPFVTWTKRLQVGTFLLQHLLIVYKPFLVFSMQANQLVFGRCLDIPRFLFWRHESEFCNIFYARRLWAFWLIEPTGNVSPLYGSRRYINLRPRPWKSKVMTLLRRFRASRLIDELILDSAWA